MCSVSNLLLIMSCSFISKVKGCPGGFKSSFISAFYCSLSLNMSVHQGALIHLRWSQFAPLSNILNTQCMRFYLMDLFFLGSNCSSWHCDFNFHLLPCSLLSFHLACLAVPMLCLSACACMCARAHVFTLYSPAHFQACELVSRRSMVWPLQVASAITVWWKQPH